jgi:hypothetical protein
MAFQGIRRSFAKLTEHDPLLHMLIQEEKDTVKALQNLRKERQESSKFLEQWAGTPYLTTEKQHTDIHDITGHLHSLNTVFGDALAELTASYSSYRDGLKVHFK